MIFSRIIYSAVVIGMVSGLILSGMQILSVDPIIFAAESYEVVEVEEGQDHGSSTWAPEDGTERTTYTILSNMTAGIGFSAILLALMSQFWRSKEKNISWLQGVIWGLAGFVAIFLAPAIGLPPEIPGVEAAPLHNRQLWWVFTILSVSTGLGILAFAAVKIKPIGLLFLAMPYIVGAPHTDGPEFSHPDPEAVAALTQLHQQFILTSGISNLIFWLILGVACGFAFNRWLRQVSTTDEYASA
jgi:cobalt transporter subunit CbtA